VERCPKVYHLIAGSKNGLMAQKLGGLITYLFFTIYCHERCKERVSIKRARELHIKNKARNLKNDIPNSTCQQTDLYYLKEQKCRSFAII